MCERSHMNVSIVAVGDNVVDCYPEHRVMFPGGNALNVSVFARRCGADTSYLGAVGADDAGEQLRSQLIHERVDIARVRVEPGSTAYCVIGHRDGDRVFLASDPGVSVFEPSADDLDFIAGHDAAHVGQSSALDEALSAIAHSTRLSYDFATRRDEEHFRSIVPMCHLASFSGGDLTASDSRQLAQRAVDAGATWALVTRGMAGAILASADGVTSCPAANSLVVDTLGAGDTFIARVLVGILRGDDPDAMLGDAARRAADTCARLGAFGAGRPISIPETTTNTRRKP
jgi:fructoselysine 6-kinase